MIRYFKKMKTGLKGTGKTFMKKASSSSLILPREKLCSHSTNSKSSLKFSIQSCKKLEKT